MPAPAPPPSLPRRLRYRARMKVVVLHDDIGPNARPDELDVFTQVEVVSQALRALGHEAAALPFSSNLQAARQNLSKLRPDIVFNLVEAVDHQGRLIYLAPALLDSMNIPYVGSPTVPMFVTSNKVLAKQLLKSHGIATPTWYSRNDLTTCNTVPYCRYIIKSTWEEASVGLDDDSIVETSSARVLLDALDNRLDRLGGDGFVEAFIDGREFNLSVLAADSGEPEVLPPAEIDFVGYAPDKPKMVGYKAKWDESSYEYHHTPRRFDFVPSDTTLLNTLIAIAKTCWKKLDLHGWVRVDFRVDSAGNPLVLEVNANPCLSPDAGFAAATQRAGLSFEKVVERILNDPVGGIASPSLASEHVH